MYESHSNINIQSHSRSRTNQNFDLFGSVTNHSPEAFLDSIIQVDDFGDQCFWLHVASSNGINNLLEFPPQVRHDALVFVFLKQDLEGIYDARFRPERDVHECATDAERVERLVHSTLDAGGVEDDIGTSTITQGADSGHKIFLQRVDDVCCAEVSGEGFANFSDF